MALTCLTVALLTVPFYLYDPRNFGPLDAASRLFRFDTLLPHLGLALGISMAALAIGFSCTAMDTAALFRNCAWVQAFPVAAGIILSSLQDRHVDLLYARYGAFFAWFTLMALAMRVSPAVADGVQPFDR